jgi:hypothetical protein
MLLLSPFGGFRPPLLGLVTSCGQACAVLESPLDTGATFDVAPAARSPFQRPYHTQWLQGHSGSRDPTGSYQTQWL